MKFLPLHSHGPGLALAVLGLFNFVGAFPKEPWESSVCYRPKPGVATHGETAKPYVGFNALPFLCADEV